MNCAQVNQRIELFVLGEVPEQEQVLIEAHLAICPACAAAEAEYRLLVAQIKRDWPPEPPRPDFMRAVHSVARAEIRATARRSLIRRTIAITASAAACLLFASMLWYVRIPDSQSPFGNRKLVVSEVEPSAISAPSISQLWEHRGALSVPGSMADDVVVHGQNVYLLQNHGRQAHVAALDAKTGKQNWLSDIQASGPLLADDSRIYCLSPSGAGRFDLVALDAADGRTLWKYPQQGDDPLRRPPGATVPATGHICWTANTAVYILRSSDGQPIWTRSIPDGGLLSAPVSVGDDIYVANAAGLYCLNMATGQESWQLAYGDTISAPGRPLLAVAGGGIYACLSLGLRASRVLCIEPARRTVRWSRDLAHVTGLYAVGNMLYLRDQDVQALDGNTGQVLWSYSATGCNPLTYTEELAYFVDSRKQGRLVALNRYTGSKVWELAGMKSCNAFIKIDGTGYVKTHDGIVHAIVFKG